MAKRETALYRIYDDVDRLLYLGIAYTPEVRVRQHSKDDWWYLADTYCVEWFDGRPEAELAEMRAVRGEGPLFNSCYGELFQSSTAEARAAAPSGLERQPLLVFKSKPRRVPKPYRIDYWDWQGRVSRISQARARQIAKSVRAKYPEMAHAFQEEEDAVIPPWGHHAVIAYAIRGSLLTLEDLATPAPSTSGARS